MIPYYVLIGAPLLFSLVHALSSDRPLGAPTIFQKKNYTILVFFGLYFLMLALRRSSVGVDLSEYIKSFHLFREYTWERTLQASRWESGFSFFTKFIGMFTDSAQVYVAIVAAVCLFPVARLYYRESEDDITVMALFCIFPVFMMNFSGLRQAIAIAFTPAVYYATRNRRLVSAILLSLLATLFHTSALVLLLIYPIYHIKLRARHMTFVFPAFILFYLFRSSLYYILIPLFGSDYASRYTTLTQTGATTMLMLFIVFALSAFYAPNDELVDSDTRGLRSILVLVVFIQVFASVSVLAMRLNYYFLILVPLLIPKVSHRITRIDARYMQLIRIAIAGFFLLYYFVKIHTQDSLDIFPYAFFWQ